MFLKTKIILWLKNFLDNFIFLINFLNKYLFTFLIFSFEFWIISTKAFHLTSFNKKFKQKNETNLKLK